MKIFISGETDSDVQYYESLQKINEIKRKIVGDYGPSLELLVIVPMIMSDEGYRVTGYEELVSYMARKKEAEARLKINYEQFKNGDAERKFALLLDNIIHSIRAVGSHVASMHLKASPEELLKMFMTKNTRNFGRSNMSWSWI